MSPLSLVRPKQFTNCTCKAFFDLYYEAFLYSAINLMVYTNLFYFCCTLYIDETSRSWSICCSRFTYWSETLFGYRALSQQYIYYFHVFLYINNIWVIQIYVSYNKISSAPSSSNEKVTLENKIVIGVISTFLLVVIFTGTEPSWPLRYTKSLLSSKFIESWSSLTNWGS